ncbi:uncharacterized protein [Diabrotica undecimpunctata]|uniref:uncharacterized protein n=1 Tax=Diabrotica undecimpunctata TaxID=50387 RepID=UPI003B6376C1
MSSSDIAQLIRNRGSLKRKLTSLTNFVNKISDGSLKPTLGDVNRRYKNYLKLLSQFEIIQQSIEEKCSDDQLEIHFNERDPFENHFYTAISYLEEYINNSSPVINATPQNVVNHDPLQNFLLPKIKLPTFNGEYEQWLEFKTNFINTIDSNSSLSAGQKFNFLKAALEGYAKRTIEGFTDSQDYHAAWNMLCNKFDRKKFLVDTHLKSIFNLNSINKSTFMQFRGLIDEVSKHLSYLEGMKLTKESLWDMTIIHVVYNKLDKVTQNKWKEYHTSAELPHLNEFLEFLKQRQDILQSQEEPHSSSMMTVKSHSGFQKPLQSRSQFHLAINQIQCNFCKSDHLIYSCPEFLRLTINDRWEKIKSLKLCPNCLRFGHSKERCSSGSCRKCKRKHNTLLHQDYSRSYQSQNTQSNAYNNNNQYNSRDTIQSVGAQNHPNNSDQVSHNSQAISHNSQAISVPNQQCLVTERNTQSNIILSTVTFKVKDQNNQLHQCRALLDSGAQSHLITEEFVKRLGLPLTNTELAIIGINQVVSNLKKKPSITIFSNKNNFQFQLSCYVTPFISTIPLQQFDISTISIPQNIELSDPTFNTPQKVDMIIGASLFWELLLDSNIKLGKHAPVLQNTKLGWVISGTVMNPISTSLCNFSQCFIPEDNQLRKFWELNEINEPMMLSKDDVQCEELFTKHTQRNENGQFVVKLPFKYSTDLLGDSKEIAKKRFISLENRFKTHPQFYQLYKNFIHEYIDLGHMTRVESDMVTETTYFFPHHGKYKPSNLTTQLGVVFDGSSPSSSGWSLNELQYVGPKVQNIIFDILIRFRLYKYVVSADVGKMYRQILIHDAHKPLQQILWRDNPADEFSIYQLNTVTYGCTSSPYLAIKCINQLAIDNCNTLPTASQTILNDFYVDDLVTGSNDLSELQTRCKDISDIIKLAQLKSIAEEISILNSNKQLPIKHKVSNLTPFLDENYVLRVGGLLRLSGLDFNSKHPILISSNHPFTKLLFEHKHKVLLHAGPQLLLSSIRQYYWPIRGRDLARKTVRNCLTCFKFKPTFASCTMASLPEAPTTPSLPFQHCGIDFAGPFLLNNKSGRGAKEIKGYVCVFVCFCNKAVNLELITNLTTDCFLSCLKRFIARRGIPNDIYSDNGSTFVGARNELKQFGQFLLKNNTYIHNYAIDYNINWHFIPPYAPNFGGLWEAAVKSMKHHLKRVLLDKKLIYEDFNSLLIQIKGVLNSRPMFALSNDPTDLTPLTPSHFLIGRPITTIPDTDLSTITIGRLSNYKTIRHMYQQFWNRYVKEYVSQLQQQYKWKESSSHLKIGTLVLIRSYQQPPCRWPLGRIINLHFGKDKLSRVAEVKTNNKTVIRSVRHLCPLPIQQESVSENINT